MTVPYMPGFGPAPAGPYAPTLDTEQARRAAKGQPKVRPLNPNEGRYDDETLRRAALFEALTNAGLDPDTAELFAMQSQPSGKGPNPPGGKTNPLDATRRGLGLAGRSALQGVGGLVDNVTTAAGADPVNAAMQQAIRRAGAGAPSIGETIGNATGLPQPQTAGERMAVAGGAGLVGSAPFGPGALLPGLLGGVAGQAATDFTGNPYAGDVAGLVAGALGAEGQNMAAKRSPTGQAATMLTKAQKAEGPAADPLALPDQAGLPTLSSRVAKPLAKALGVPPEDSRARLAALEATIKSEGDRLYPPMHGPSSAPTMVPVTPRLRTLLQNPDVRRAVMEQGQFLNTALESNGQPRTPFAPIYGMDGRLVVKEVPLELLDKAKQGFDLVSAKQPSGQAIQRVAGRDISAKVGELRAATDEALASIGNTDYPKARAIIQNLEGRRDALLKGIELFKPTEEGTRDTRVPQTRQSIQSEIAAMTPEQAHEFRLGAFGSALERLTTKGVNPEALQRLQAIAPPGADLQQVVKALRAGQTQTGLMAEAGSRAPSSVEATGGVKTGALEAASGIKRRGLFHALQALAKGELTPEGQQALQSYLVTPEGSNALLAAMKDMKATAGQGMAGSVVGAGSAKAKPDSTQTPPR